MNPPANTPVLLYVEDSLDDRVLFAKACARSNARFKLRYVEHGQQAIDYLGGAGEYANRAESPLPDGVLLDVKMPILDGFAVLRWIREQESFAHFPILVFTSSYQHSDIERAYAEKATAFLTKPSDFQALINLTGALWECFAFPNFQIGPLETLPQFKRP
jgi:CheY-like chemotaxis protein